MTAQVRVTQELVGNYRVAASIKGSAESREHGCSVDHSIHVANRCGDLPIHHSFPSFLSSLFTYDVFTK